MSQPPLACTNVYLRDDSTLVVHSRDAGGALRRRVLPAEWVAYYSRSEMTEELLHMLRTTSYVRGIVAEGRWWRVSYADRGARTAMVDDERSPLRQAGVAAYEGDVHPAARWLADNAVLVQKPRRVFVDIETDSRCTFAAAVEGDARVLSIALVCEETGRVFSNVLEEWSDEAEGRLLAWFWGVLESYDQVVVWNGDGFDFPVLWARSRRVRQRVDSNRWLWIDMMEVFKKYNLAVAESGEEKRSMSLENIGKAVVGRGKLAAPPWAAALAAGRALGACTYEFWEAGGDFRKLLVDYNVQDTELLRAIEQRRPYLALFDTICEACSVVPNSRSLHSTVEMDGFMMKLGRQRDYHFPTRVFREDVAKRKGAYVMKPKVHGIGRNIHVADFKSLYPSIILTFNMSPETKRTDVPVNGPLPPGVCRAANGAAFSTAVTGILVEAEQECLRLRDHFKKLVAQHPPNSPEWHDAKRKSNAYKLLGNSFYGVVLSPFSRYYDPDIGEGITQSGAWLIKRTAQAAEDYGLAFGAEWRAVYIDTDGLYVTGPTEEQFREFVKWCNAELYPKLLREVGCVQNHIRTAYEKEYARLIFQAGKTFVGSFVHYEGQRATPDTEPEIKGVAYARGDAIRLTAALQAELIDLLVGGMKVATDGPVPTDDLARYRALLERHKKRVLEGPLPVEEVARSQALDRPLRDYVVRRRADGKESLPAHVEVAHILKERGREIREGTRVEYVVTDGSTSPMKVMPAEDYTGAEADRHYLWENLVFPPTQKLLEAAFPMLDERGRPNMEHDWSRWARTRPKKDKHALPGQTALFGDNRVSPVPEERRELHVVFVSGDDDAMVELESCLAHLEGEDPLEVVVWETSVGGRFALGSFRRLVNFDALAGDHHLRALLRRLGAHFAA